jgi:hypothetical protein
MCLSFRSLQVRAANGHGLQYRRRKTTSAHSDVAEANFPFRKVGRPGPVMRPFTVCEAGLSPFIGFGGWAHRPFTVFEAGPSPFHGF